MNDAPVPPAPDAPEGTRYAQQQVASADVSAATVALIVLASLAVLATLSVAAGIILPLLLAVVMTLLLAPPKRFLVDRLRVPPALASLLLILVVFAAIGGLVFALTLPASSWISKLPQAETTLQHKLGFIGSAVDYVSRSMSHVSGLMQGGSHAAAGSGAPAAGSAGHTAANAAAPPPHPAAAASQATPAATTAPAPSAPAASGGGSSAASLGGLGLSVLRGTRDILGQLLTLVVTLFFTLAYGDTLLRRVVEVMPTFGDKRRLVEIASEIEDNISAYLLTITMMNLFTGAANFVSMWLQGFPDPLLWGTLAFLLNYIPILGPLTGVVIFLLVGLFVKSSLWGALLPPLVYLGVHVLEGESLTPMLLARRFTLNPVLVIVSLFFWDWMWGVVGAFMAVPLLAIAKIVCDHIPALTPLGHVLGAPKRQGLQA